MFYGVPAIGDSLNYKRNHKESDKRNGGTKKGRQISSKLLTLKLGKHFFTLIGWPIQLKNHVWLERTELTNWYSSFEGLSWVTS